MVVNLDNTHILYNTIPYNTNTTKLETAITKPFFKLEAPKICMVVDMVMVILIYFFGGGRTC